LLFRMTLQHGRHGHAWVLARECEDACACYAVGVGVEFGAGSHLVAEV
jgi:hypothetical protein